MNIKDVMTPCPYYVGARTSLDDALKKMALYSIRHLPVVEKGELIGVLAERDVRLSQFVCKATNYCPDVGETCATDVYAVKGNEDVSEVALHMSEKKVACAIVVDDEEQVIGIFTTTDACRLVHLLLNKK